MTMLSEAKDYRRVADEVQLADSPSITPADLIAVKCLLGWSSVRLSSRLGTTYGTLQKFILGRKIARPFKVPEVLAALRLTGSSSSPTRAAALE
jgi:hypothetical protein